MESWERNNNRHQIMLLRHEVKRVRCFYVDKILKNQVWCAEKGYNLSWKVLF